MDRSPGAGFVTWHNDGTELTNSGREPLTGSFCINHYALSWDPTGRVLIGPTNIRENVSVDARGNHYSGTFSIDQFATDEKTVLAHVGGAVSATRIAVD